MGASPQPRSMAHLRPRHPAIPLRHRRLPRPHPPARIRHRLAAKPRRAQSMAARNPSRPRTYHRLPATPHPSQTTRPPKRRSPIPKNRQNRRRLHHPRKRAAILGKPRQIPRHRAIPRPPQHPPKSRQHRRRQTLSQPIFLHRQLHRLCSHRRRHQQRNR